MPRTNSAAALWALLLQMLLVHANVVGGAAAATAAAAAPAAAFAAVAHAVPVGGQLHVTDYKLEGDVSASNLELTRFEVFTPDAQIWVQASTTSPPLRIARPTTAFYKGSVAGTPGSTVLLSIQPNGKMAGLVHRGNESFSLSRVLPTAANNHGVAAARATAPLLSRKATNAQVKALPRFQCGTDHHRPANSAATRQPVTITRQLLQSVVNSRFQAKVAVESDYEFYNEFRGSADPTAEAIDYIALLFGYGDIVFSREINMDLMVGFVRFWDTPSDPWRASSDMRAALYELESHWNKNMAAQKRTVVYMASGKSLGGGAAYGNYWFDSTNKWATACSSETSPGFSQDYALCGAIGGPYTRFEWPLTNPAAATWDIMCTLHELGHTFGSPHSHEYCGLGGNAATVDNCYMSSLECDQSGTVFDGEYGELPTCSRSTPHWPTSGKGTLMSYCHLLSWDENVAMTFGRGHTCGTAPERIATQIRQNVAYLAAKFPKCITTKSPPRPPPPRPSPPPPPLPPPRSGNWRKPLLISKLPYNSATLESQTFTDLSYPPINKASNFLGNSRPMVVFKYFASASSAGRRMIVSSCNTAKYPASGDAVVTVLSTAKEWQAVSSAVGWKYIGADDDSCGLGQFELSISLVANTWYFIAASLYNPQYEASYTLQVKLQAAPPPPPRRRPPPPTPPPPRRKAPPPPPPRRKAPPPPPPRRKPPPPPAQQDGSWFNPVLIKKLPFVSKQLNTQSFPVGLSYPPIPWPHGYLGNSCPSMVFKFYVLSALGGRQMIVDSCQSPARGPSTVTVLSAATEYQSVDKKTGWTYVGCASHWNSDIRSCNNTESFRMLITLAPKRWYFFSVSTEYCLSSKPTASFTLRVTERAMPPPELGSWRKPVHIKSLPFATSYLDTRTFPTDLAYPPLGAWPKAGWLGERRPMMVFKFFADATLAGQRLVVCNCPTAQYPGGGINVVTVLSAANEWQPIGNARGWTLVGFSDQTSRCPNDVFINFNFPFTLSANTWYFLAASPWEPNFSTGFHFRAELLGTQRLPSSQLQQPTGSWSNPTIVPEGISGTPFVTPPIQTFFSAPPVACSLSTNTGQPAHVFQWYSGSRLPAGVQLVLDSCGTVTGAMMPVVSVLRARHVGNSPYTCLGHSTTGCGAGVAGFRLMLEPMLLNTHYRFAVHIVSFMPGSSIRLSITLVLPPGAGAGS